ncbi:hypothetical protein D9613_008837 [Agrocybe pediades]|uniref:Uncharacterized protein n=1 Tax=Agrocybe pediades TaxID=84607 RepID=A0A8H4QSP8_9AGAR|nr:hypothetical protein D9613_008837 [Agrocybe pediades]
MDIRIPSLKDEGKSDSSVFEVEDWFKMVCAGNNSEDDVKAFMVQQLDWYKNGAGFEHEYLVATISGPANSTIHLRFERRSTSEQLKKAQLNNVVGDENEKGLSDKDRRAAQQALEEERKLINAAKGPYASRFSKASSSSAGSNLKAADHVVRVRNPLMLNDNCSDRAYLMMTYNNFQTPFSLRDLAVIVHEVSKDSRCYNAITEQCYWLVRTVVGVATELYRSAEPIKTARADRAGKFIIQSVSRDIPLEIGKFVKKVTESIEADNSRINMVWKDGKGGRLEAEKARAEAEARADSEARARAAEAAARFEVETRMRAMEEELALYRRDTCVEAQG